MGKEGFAVSRDCRCLLIRPGGITLRQIKQPLPGLHLLQTGAGLRSKTVKGRLIDIHDLRGLCYRKDQLSAADPPFLQKLGKKRLARLLVKILLIIQQYPVVRHSQNRFGIGDKHIRQFSRPWIPVCRGENVLMDCVCVRHRGHLNIDSFLFPCRLVILINDRVKRRICLSSIDMPDRQRNIMPFLISFLHPAACCG